MHSHSVYMRTRSPAYRLIPRFIVFKVIVDAVHQVDLQACVSIQPSDEAAARVDQILETLLTVLLLGWI